jgi:hypothetical protein
VIDRLSLTGNEQQIWLAAFAQCATLDAREPSPTELRLQRAARFAEIADQAVTRYRELLHHKRPLERP